MASPRPDTRRKAVTDAVALLAFVAVGTASHERAFTLPAFASTVVPLLGAWFAVAIAVHLYRGDGLRPLVWTWLAAAPLAAVVRSALRGGPWDERLPIFAAVALAFTALFVLAGRALVMAFDRARQDPSPSEPRGRSSDVTS